MGNWLNYLYATVIICSWFLAGIGTAVAEKQARRDSDRLDKITIFFWPAALITWALSEEV